MTEEKGVPVKVSAGTVPALPVNVGTPTGQLTAGAVTVPAGVPPLTLELVALEPVNV
jgi:hypothetical protein